MFILVLGKRLYRAAVIVLIVLLVLPVLQFYASRALNPQTVHFREPRGEALKVSVDGVNRGIPVNAPAAKRFLYFLHEFYQNGL